MLAVRPQISIAVYILSPFVGFCWLTTNFQALTQMKRFWRLDPGSVWRFFASHECQRFGIQGTIENETMIRVTSIKAAYAFAQKRTDTKYKLF